MGIPIRAKRIHRIRIPCKASHSSSLFEKNVQMLQYFQEEYIYRHTHFWQILIKLFVLSTAITIVPITSQVIGIEFNENVQHFSLCFPILGLLVAVFSYHILVAESNRMNAVGKAKYRVCEKLGKRYQYEGFGKNKVPSSEAQNIEKRKYLSNRIPLFVLILECLIVLCVLIFLFYVPIAPAAPDVPA